MDKIMSEQLDRIEANQIEQGEQLNKITTVLGGSGMGDKGLIEQMQELKVSHYQNKADADKTKSEVSRLKWIASGIATFISGLWAAAVTWWNS